jgi:hypothetical protein
MLARNTVVKPRLLCLALLLAIGSSWRAPDPASGHAVRPLALTPQQLVQQGHRLIQQLHALTAQNWARVAGLDTGLPPRVNGHDEFVAEWTQQMLRLLKGLPVGVVHQAFQTPGFRNLPATRPGVNIIVVVPGARHADQALIIGAHPDGEPTSKGSAYDDASGCVILLGLAELLGQYWRTYGLPSLTVEFVLFDAEEEGLVGSAAFHFAYRSGALMPRPIFMIDEEQSGVGYPVRPFGMHSQSPLPSYAITTGDLPARLVRLFGGASQPNQAALRVAIQRLNSARSSAFGDLHGAYPVLPYRGGSASAFLRSDQQYLKIGPIPLCCSDNAAFEALGLPTVTFAGNSDYYAHDAQPWSFPYDQPEDTLAALACDTGGTPEPGVALEAALELPLQLSSALVLDYAPSPSAGGRGTANLAVFSTLATARQPTSFQAIGANQATWDFGDGSRASGANVSHTFAKPGTFSVAVRSGRLSRRVRLTVSDHPLIYKSLFSVSPPPRRPWSPAALQDIAGCH